MNHVLRVWIPLGVTATAIFASFFVILQQYIRVSAYDLPTQISEDLASLLASGNTVPQLSAASIELASSLAPFAIVYDEQGSIVAGSALLDGKTPQLPKGVLDHAKRKGQHRVTWQPRKGVREAVVITYFSGKTEGYVLAGRSLRETEIRINRTLLLTCAGMLFTLITSGAASYFATIKERRKRR